jgi:NhaP-type Na+/H+ or K+/H+ antiporter
VVGEFIKRVTVGLLIGLVIGLLVASLMSNRKSK